MMMSVVHNTEFVLGIFSGDVQSKLYSNIYPPFVSLTHTHCLSLC